MTRPIQQPFQCPCSLCRSRKDQFHPDETPVPARLIPRLTEAGPEELRGEKELTAPGGWEQPPGV